MNKNIRIISVVLLSFLVFGPVQAYAAGAFNAPGLNGSYCNGSGFNGPGANGGYFNGSGFNGPGANGKFFNGNGFNGPGMNSSYVNGSSLNSSRYQGKRAAKKKTLKNAVTSQREGGLRLNGIILSKDRKNTAQAVAEQ